MLEITRPIAMIPSDCFRWQPRVQFIDSFRTREAALNCAFENGYNLIVERNEGNCPLFDVLDDPEEACTSGLELEMLRTEEILVEADTEGWINLMLSSISSLSRRLGARVMGLYLQKIAPRFRQTASRQQWAAFRRAARLAWYRHAHWGIRSLNKQFRAAARLFCSEITAHCRQAANKYWWSGSAVDFRRLVHRHAQGDVLDIARRLYAIVAIKYTHEVSPRLRHAASRVRQADLEHAFQRAWGISLPASRNLARRIAATANSLYIHKIAPRLNQVAIRGALRRAWSTTLLTAICLTDRSAAAVASLYVRQVAPRLRSAAAHYQQADIEGTFRRSIVAVTPPPRSRVSQLH